MQKSIGLLLIVAAIALGYFGFKNMDEKKADIKIGEVEVTARSSETKEKGYVLLGASALCLILGVVLVSRADRK